jgi:hypothetical protein
VRKRFSKWDPFRVLTGGENGTLFTLGLLKLYPFLRGFCQHFRKCTLFKTTLEKNTIFSQIFGRIPYPNRVTRVTRSLLKNRPLYSIIVTHMRTHFESKCPRDYIFLRSQNYLYATLWLHCRYNRFTFTHYKVCGHSFTMITYQCLCDLNVWSLVNTITLRIMNALSCTL